MRPKQPTLTGDLTALTSPHGTKTARAASKPVIQIVDPHHHDQESPGSASLNSMSSHDPNERKDDDKDGSNETPLLKNLQTLGQNIWSNLFKNTGS